MNARKIQVYIVAEPSFHALPLKELLSKDAAFSVYSLSCATTTYSCVGVPEPDVVVLDVQDPTLQSQELEALLETFNVPVVVLTDTQIHAHDVPTDASIEFMQRCVGTDERDIDNFSTLLAIRLKDLGFRRLQQTSEMHTRTRKPTNYATPAHDGQASTQLIAIGASLGGVEATMELLSYLDPTHLPGIVIVQHMKKGFTKGYAAQLNRNTPFTVREASDGDIITDGLVLVACAGKQLMVKRRAESFHVRSFLDCEYNGFCPSVDTLFKSVAFEAASKAVGIILTGIGHDGVEGLCAMHDVGCHTWGQSKESCVVYGMPAAAYKAGAVDTQGDLKSIAAGLQRYFKGYPK